jgi:hypothetical protein
MLQGDHYHIPQVLILDLSKGSQVNHAINEGDLARRSQR